MSFSYSINDGAITGTCNTRDEWNEIVTENYLTMEKCVLNGDAPENIGVFFVDFYMLMENIPPNIKIIDVTNFNIANVTSLSSMFEGCNLLEKIIGLEEWNTNNIIDMSYLFNDCTNLYDFNIKNWDTSNVTDMTSMFWGCKALTKLDLKNFDTSNVEQMDQMFQNCTSIKSIDISNFKLNSNFRISDMFANCDELYEIILPDTTRDTWNDEWVDAERMFYMCTKLEHIYVKNSWEWPEHFDYENMFYGCEKLPNFNSDIVDGTKAYIGEGGYLEKLITVIIQNKIKKNGVIANVYPKLNIDNKTLEYTNEILGVKRNIIFLTQSEYNKILAQAQDKMYIITDAEEGSPAVKVGSQPLTNAKFGTHLVKKMMLNNQQIYIKTNPEPDNQPLYSLSTETIFDGTDDYIDTGINIWKYIDGVKSSDGFTIALRFKTSQAASTTTYPTIFQNDWEAGQWPGIKCDLGHANIRMAGRQNENNNQPFSKAVNDNTVKTLFITCNGSTVTTYSYSNDIYDKTLTDTMKNPSQLNSTTIPFNLIIGANKLTDGSLNRFFNGTIYNFEIWPGVKNTTWIDNWFIEKEIATYVWEPVYTAASLSATTNSKDINFGAKINWLNATVYKYDFDYTLGNDIITSTQISLRDCNTQSVQFLSGTGHHAGDTGHITHEVTNNRERSKESFISRYYNANYTITLTNVVISKLVEYVPVVHTPTTYDLLTDTIVTSEIGTGDILNCGYSGAKKEVTLPNGSYQLECWGSKGNQTRAGNGGYTKGTLSLSENTTLILYCGGTDGFNGGGTSAKYGTKGGGATDIRIAQDSLYARVIVAGGGGGGGYSATVGGYAGGETGGQGGNGTVTGGYGGTQTGGGSNNVKGTFGIGGNSTAGGGGGGGWYGGASGMSGSTDSGGGGGSSYVYTSSTATNYPSGCLLSAANLLTNTENKGGNTSFLSPTGENETGHGSDGYIRITVL